MTPPPAAAPVVSYIPVCPTRIGMDFNGRNVCANYRAEGAFRTDRVTYRVRDEYENLGSPTWAVWPKSKGVREADSGSQKKIGLCKRLEKAFLICEVGVLPREGVDRVVRPLWNTSETTENRDAGQGFWAL